MNQNKNPLRRLPALLPAALGLALSASPAPARWAALKDADSVYEFWRSSYKVEKDGSYSSATEFQAKILKASSISYFGNYSLTYNEQSESLEILSAKSIHGGKEFPADLKLIEDKPLAAAHGGFDQIRQVRVVFPKIQIGSSVYMRWRFRQKTPPFQNFFSYLHGGAYSSFFARKMSFKIDSALPLLRRINNPGGFWKTSYRESGRGGDRRHVFQASLRRPIFKAIINEKNSYPDPKLFPSIEISTAASWAQMTKGMAGKYEKIMREPLPRLHRDILKAAKKIKTGPEDQIDFVIARLIESVRYLRDWRSVNGGYIPRPLSKIAETGYGDCKDMSVSLAAILRGLGFQAHAALIERGGVPRPPGYFQLPSRLAFNHAIVYARLPDGGGQSSAAKQSRRQARQGKQARKAFWLDPTNSITYARGLFEDIADRPALILRNPEPEMTRTPKLQSAGAEVYLTQEFRLLKDGSAKAKGEMRFSGRRAADFAGASLYKSRKSIDYDLIQYTGANTSTLESWKVRGYDLSSRVARDFSASFSYMERDGGLFNFWTQMGPGFRFPFLNNLSLFYVRAKGRVSGLFALHPQRYVFVSKLKNIKPLGDLSLNCRLQSPWADFSREAISKEPLIIKDIYEFKKARISARELKSPEFFLLSNGLSRCFNRFLMVYQKTD